MKPILLFFMLFFGSIATYAQEASSLKSIQFGDPDAPTAAVVSLSGRISDSKTGEVLAGAVLQVVNSSPQIATVTDADGKYVLEMPSGENLLKIQLLGYDDYDVLVRIYQNSSFAIPMSSGSIDLSQVTVTDVRSNENVTNVLSGVEQLSIEKIERQSKLLGEADVLRSLQAVTGVSSVGEGASGFNVRGGNTDENLILMDGNLIFNPVHALGFFSLFHPDMVEGVTLFKGGVPAKYGGRLSSVLDVQLREGDYQKLSLKGGLGIASSRLAVEGPLVKDKASIIVGGRISYFDWILQQTSNIDLRKSQAFFYDLTAKADARLTPTTKIGFTAFATHDNFQFAEEVKFDYETQSGSAYLKQLIGDKLNLTAQVNIGTYQSNLFDINGNDQSKFINQIDYQRGSLNAYFQPIGGYELQIGVEQSRYNVSPGELQPLAESVIAAEKLPKEKGHETSFFLHNQCSISDNLELMAGIRYTIFDNLGPDQVFLYEANRPKTERTIVDSIGFADGEQIVRYTGFEPRFSLRYSLGESRSVKLGYNRSYQFFSQISNTASATPIDIWQLSNYYIQPQRADNFSVGYYHNFRENTIKSYLVLFYRDIEGLIEYKDFARLLLNDHLETELLSGQSKAYGVEFLINKSYGRHQLELNYTFSRSIRQITPTDEQVTINNGTWYPSNYDKPHNLNLNYFLQINPKNSLSVNFTYSTGRPTTAPVSSFSNSNVLTIPVYSDRNQFRVPDYHRMDVAYTIGPWGKKERWRNSLTFSIYNLYFRKNAFSVFFRQNPFQSVTTYRVAVLGTIFPALTYNFTF